MPFSIALISAIRGTNLSLCDGASAWTTLLSWPRYDPSDKAESDKNQDFRSTRHRRSFRRKTWLANSEEFWSCHSLRAVGLQVRLYPHAVCVRRKRIESSLSTHFPFCLFMLPSCIDGLKPLENYSHNYTQYHDHPWGNLFAVLSCALPLAYPFQCYLLIIFSAIFSSQRPESWLGCWRECFCHWRLLFSPLPSATKPWSLVGILLERSKIDKQRHWVDILKSQ